MKLINEKGKFLGLINIIDLAVLLVLLLVVFAAAVKLTGGNIKAPIASAKTRVTVVTRTQARPEWLAKSFNPGDQLMNGNLFVDDTFITNVEIKPFMVNVSLPSGELILAEDPELREIYFTITSLVDTSPNQRKIGDIVLRIGNQFNIYTKNAQVGSTIASIEYGK